MSTASPLDLVSGLYDASRRQLRISTDNAPSEAIARLVSTKLSGDDLVLSDADAPAAVAGSKGIRAGGSLALLDLPALPAELYFFSRKGVLQLAARVRLSPKKGLAKWRIGQAFAPLADTLFDELRSTGAGVWLTVATCWGRDPAHGDRFALGYSVSGEFDSQSPALQTLGWWLEEGPTARLFGTLYTKKVGPQLSLALPEKDLPFFTEHSATLRAGVRSAPMRALSKLQCALYYDARLKVGDETLQFLAALPDPSSGIAGLRLSFENGDGRPPLDQLGAFFGGADPLSALPKSHRDASLVQLEELRFEVGVSDRSLLAAGVKLSALKSHPVVLIKDLVELEEVDFSLTMRPSGDGTSVSGNLSALLKIGKGELEVSGSYPGWIVVAELVYGKLTLKDLLGHFNSDLDVDALAISELYLRVDPSQRSFIAEAAVDAWKAKLGTKSLQLDEVSFTLQYDPSGGFGGSLTGEFDIAGTSLYVTAAHPGKDQGWQFSGGTLPGSTVSLTALAKALLKRAGVSWASKVPDIELGDLEVSFDTQTQAFAFQTRTAQPMKLTLVQQDFELSFDVSLQSDKGDDGQRFLQGTFGADVEIGGQTFRVEYDMGQKTHVFKGSWEAAAGESLALGDFVRGIGLRYQGHDDIDALLAFTSASFEFNVNTTTLTLTATTKAGEAFFVADDSTGSWGFAFGVVLDDRAHVPKGSTSQLLRRMRSAVDFQQALLIFSTEARPSFQVPGFNAVGTRALKLSPGLMVAADVDLRKAPTSDPGVQHLRDSVSETQLLFVGEVSGDHSFMEAVLSGAATVKGQGDDSVSLDDAIIRLGFKPLDIELRGTATFPLRIGDGDDASTVHGTGLAILSISESTAQASFNLAFDGDGLPMPMGLKGVSLQDVGALIGVTFEPPGVEAGLEGVFLIDGEAQSDRFVFVFSVEDELPDPLCIWIEIAELSVRAMITAFTDRDPAQLPAILDEISARQLYLYWVQPNAEDGVLLPDGTLAQAGFGFNGALQIGSFRAHGALQIRGKGISGDAEISPVHLAHKGKPLLDITGNGKGVFPAATTPSETGLTNQPNSSVSMDPLVAPGGPVVAFSDLKSPYLQISLNVTLFGVVGTDIEATATSKGFEFDLHCFLAGILDFSLSCTLDSTPSFSADAKASIHLAGDIELPEIAGHSLGHISLDVGFDAELAISADREQFQLQVSGDFEWEGRQLRIPTLTLDVPLETLKELPEKILEHIEAEAASVFEDFIAEMKKFFDDAKKDIEAFGKDVDEACQKIADDADKAVKAVEAEAGKLADDAKQAWDDAKRVEAEAKSIVQDAENEAKSIVQDAKDEVQDIEKKIEDFGRRAVTEVNKIIGDLKATAQKLEDEAKQVLEDIGAELGKIVQDTKQLIANIEKEAEKAIDDIVAKAEQAIDALKREADALWDDIKALGKKAEDALEKAGEKIGDFFRGL